MRIDSFISLRPAIAGREATSSASSCVGRRRLEDVYALRRLHGNTKRHARQHCRQRAATPKAWHEPDSAHSILLFAILDMMAHEAAGERREMFGKLYGTR